MQLGTRADKAAATDDAWPLVYAARHRDDGVRARSSSGGAFHALAEWAILGQGGVVYGCAFDEALRGRHVRCETMEAAERCMGSKYAQSAMGDTVSLVRRDVDAHRTVLFTGTPCQVDAVRRACGDADCLVTADIICHGVPSPGLFGLHMRLLGDTYGDAVATYRHRDKEISWRHRESFTLSSGRKVSRTPLADSWRRLFYSHRYFRPSCAVCPYTQVRRPSDVTIGDFWGIGRTSLRDLDDGLGVSLVLANTARGGEVLESCGLELHEASLADALPANPMLERPAPVKGDRTSSWEALYGGGYEALLVKERFRRSLPRWLAARVREALGGRI